MTSPAKEGVAQKHRAAKKAEVFKVARTSPNQPSQISSNCQLRNLNARRVNTLFNWEHRLDAPTPETNQGAAN